MNDPTWKDAMKVYKIVDDDKWWAFVEAHNMQEAIQKAKEKGYEGVIYPVGVLPTN